jgi:PAS domain S-box-containing protein
MVKNKSGKSLVLVFFISMLFITVVSISIIGYSWINHERGKFVEDSENLRKEYIESQKSMIRDETEKVLDYVRYYRSRMDQQMSRLLKERVYEAHAVASAIYSKYHDRRSKAEIIGMIKDALRPVRFSRGRGYFFIYTMQGKLVLYPVKPQIEGRDHINLQDRYGVYVVRNEIETVKRQTEGFVRNKAGSSAANGEIIYPKISFVKYFEPYDWFIGSKEYRIDFVQDIQRELLDRIVKIRFGDDGYIFVFNYKGVTLVHPLQENLVGQNLWELQDSNGVKPIQEIRKAVEKPGGDFVSYNWNKPSTGIPAPKISFVKGLKDWQWMIGAGVYLDEIDRMIAGRRLELQNYVKDQAVRIVLLSLIIVSVVLFITLFFSRKLRREFDVFLAFFKKSEVGHEPIDKNKLYAEEFKILADSANRMLEERRKMESSLREREEQLAVTFRSIGDGVITTDVDANVVMINRAAEQLTGWEQEEAQGKLIETVFNIIEETGGIPVENPVRRTLETGEIIVMGQPAVLLVRDGNRRLVADSAAPIRDKDSKIIGAVMVFMDVTDKRKIEEELRKTQKLESLGVLAGGIAHDFNNLLTSVLGNINLAKTLAKEKDNLYTTLAMAENATLKTRELTQQLLTFARGGTPIKKVHDLSPLLQEAVTFSLRGSNVKSSFMIPDDLWPVEVDEGQMNQVFNNLIINAIQAMPGGGVVEVTARNVDYGAGEETPSLLTLENKRYIKVTIKDNGCGISEEHLPLVFDPYFTTKETGSGLGLTSVYSIVSRHKGCIDVRSGPGEGTSFILHLPAAEKGEDKLKRKRKQKEESSHKGSGRVLVMDDDKMVGDVVKRQLRHLGYQAEVAYDGSEAIDLYKNARENGQPFDVVLMDLTIPGGMGGAEATKRLLEIDPTLKAIVSSGYSNDPIMADFKPYGFKDCIVKPYKLQELGKTLKRVLNTSPSG